MCIEPVYFYQKNKNSYILPLYDIYMKKILRQMILCLVCLLLFTITLIPAKAEENDDGNEIIHSRFYALTTEKNADLEVPFNRNWFKQDATVYSHDLAKLSIGLATAAFRPNLKVEQEITSTDMNLSRFLSEAHFIDLRSDDYDKDPSMFTVSTVMGHQKIGTGDDAFELIAVGVCGQGYVDEWESNFTIGDGKVHEGFKRSSDLIYDRIFGYIASTHLEGPMKIWISGFSRAAAVSNVTAARLTESTLFREETVFAYTFATPRTVIDEDYARYDNIFNIVGKADPVPAVPFADWGYERYGTTLFLPTLETDSDFTQKRLVANQVYKQLTGIDYWYNETANSVANTIMRYFLELFPTAAIYNRCLQDKLIHIWEDRSPANVLKNLLSIANDQNLINEENRGEANSLLNYLTMLLYDYVGNDTVFRKWNRNASAGANILQAHTPELYVSWMFSADSAEELYSRSDHYTVLYIDPSSKISLLKNGTEIESIQPSVERDVNTGEATELIPKSERVTPEGNIYLDYYEDYIRATIPRDSEYSLYAEAVKESSYDFVAIDYTVGVQTGQKSTLTYVILDPGNSVTLQLPSDGDIFYTTAIPVEEKNKYQYTISASASESVYLARPKSFPVSWRHLIIGIISAATLVIMLIVFQIVFIIGKIRFKAKVKKGWIAKDTKYRAMPILCIVLIFTLFAMMELFSYLLDDAVQMQTLFKLMIGGLSVIIALSGFLRRKSTISGVIVVALVLLTIADIITSHSLVYGSCLHIAAYVLLSIAFIYEERPGLTQVICWVIFSAAGIQILSFIKGEYGLLRILAMVYFAAVMLMVITSFGQSRRIFTGALFLFIAGILLMFNEINGRTFISHILSLGIYYMAIAILASNNVRIPIPRLVPAEE